MNIPTYTRVSNHVQKHYPEVIKNMIMYHTSTAPDPYDITSFQEGTYIIGGRDWITRAQLAKNIIRYMVRHKQLKPCIFTASPEVFLNVPEIDDNTICYGESLQSGNICKKDVSMVVNHFMATQKTNNRIVYLEVSDYSIHDVNQLSRFYTELKKKRPTVLLISARRIVDIWSNISIARYFITADRSDLHWMEIDISLNRARIGKLEKKGTNIVNADKETFFMTDRFQHNNLKKCWICSSLIEKYLDGVG